MTTNKEKNLSPEALKKKAMKEWDELLYDRFYFSDMRVAKVVSVENHPDSEKLYISKLFMNEQIEAEPRQVLFGLKPHYDIKDLNQSKVVLFANMRDRKLAGYNSSGMVMCAVKGEEGRQVGLLKVPDDVRPGERLFLEQDKMMVYNEPLMYKLKSKARRKIPEFVMKELSIDGNGELVYNKKWKVKVGEGKCITADKGMVNCSVS